MSTAEIVPVVPLNEVEVFKSKGVARIEYAKTKVIQTKDDYVEVSELRKAIKIDKSIIDEKFDPLIKNAHRAHKAACDLKREVMAPLDMANRLISQKVLAYDNEQERIRRKKQMEADAAARKEQKRLDDINKKKIAKAKAKGDKETANELKENAPVVPIRTVEKEVPKVSGQHKRANWKARPAKGKTEKEVIKFISREYLMMDWQKVNGVAKAVKGESPIKHIEFYNDETLV